MKKKYKILMLFATMVVCTGLQSQSLTPVVISSGGGYFTSATASLSFTVAEMTMVQTFSALDNILTQGFQQPVDFTVEIPENFTQPGDMLIYPNPTSGQFAISLEGIGSTNEMIKIYDLVGQLVFAKVLNQDAGSRIINLDISNFKQGVYLLELTTIDTKGVRTSCVNKINLVY